MAVSFQIKGVRDFIARLDTTVAEVRKAAEAGLREEAEIEMEEAKRRTPVDTGALRASGHVEQQGLRVTLAFGGPAASYAEKVHEDVEAFHRVGQAKFLESTLKESAPHMTERLAVRIRKKLGGRLRFRRTP